MKSTRFLQFVQSQRPRLHYMQTFRVFKKMRIVHKLEDKCEKTGKLRKA